MTGRTTGRIQDWSKYRDRTDAEIKRHCRECAKKHPHGDGWTHYQSEAEYWEGVSRCAECGARRIDVGVDAAGLDAARNIIWRPCECGSADVCGGKTLHKAVREDGEDGEDGENGEGETYLECRSCKRRVKFE